MGISLPDYARTFIVRARVVGRRIGVGEATAIFITGDPSSPTSGGWAAGDTFWFIGNSYPPVLAVGVVDTVDGDGIPLTYHLTSGSSALFPDPTVLWPISPVIDAIATSAVDVGGSGYAPGDTFVVNSANYAAGVVDTVDGGGAVLTYHLISDGVAATVGIASTAAVTGSGDGAFTIDILTLFTSSGTAGVGCVAIVTGIDRPDIEDSAWDCEGVLRGNGDTAYSWVGGSAPVFTVIAQDTAAAAWAVTIAVTDLNLEVAVTGEVGKTIDWNGTIELDEVG
jgi:hypothetical protein